MIEQLEGAWIMGRNRLYLACALASVILVGCFSGAGAGTEPGASATAQPTPAASPTAEPSMVLAIDASIAAISASKPGAEAAAVLAQCNVGEQITIDKVTGMGKIASASDLARYVPLTGREPQLKERGPAWIVTVAAELPQPGSTELWVNPTCVVTDGDAGYFATGPVKDLATGKTMTPEKPATPPDLRLPPLAP